MTTEQTRAELLRVDLDEVEYLEVEEDDKEGDRLALITRKARHEFDARSVFELAQEAAEGKR